MKINNKINVCILYGGKTVEHDVSIISAIQVYNAIDKNKYNVSLLYIDRDNQILTAQNLDDINCYKNNDFKKVEYIYLYSKNKNSYYSSIKQKKQEIKIDVIVPVVHGEGVEDGIIYSFLKMLNIPNTISNVTSSVIAQNKFLTKLVLKNMNIEVLDYKVISINDSKEAIREKIKNLGSNLIFKPISLGSSIGISIINNLDDINTSSIFKYCEEVIVEPLVEEFIEYNCACIKVNDDYILSSIEEIELETDIYSFEQKYSNNKKVKKTLPALIDNSLKSKIYNTTKEIYQKLNFFGVIRIDYIYDLKTKRIYVTEINTIPGSYAYYLFTKEGISFPKLLDLLIKEAIKRNNNQNKEYYSDLFEREINIRIK